MSALEETIFGRIVDGDDVEQWTLAVLKTWSSTFIAEKERQKGIPAGSLPRIRAWRTTPSLDKWPEDQLPALLLQSLGTAEEPLKDGRGIYRARWQMNIAVICSAATEADARRLGMIYLAAHRTLLMQRSSLDGVADGIDWQGEDYTQIAYDDQRTLAAPQAAFTIEIADVTFAKAGPSTPDEPLVPDTQPWPPWPEVATHDVDVELTPVDEPLPKGGADDAPRR